MASSRVRRAEPGEGPELTDLARRSKAHWGYDAAFMAACGEALTISEAAIAAGHVFVASDRDVDAASHLLGVAAAVPLNPHSADLTHLFVDPPAMGRGIGRQLMEAIEAWLVERGIQHLEILADPQAVPFYRKMGAVEIGDAPSDAIPGRRLPLLRYSRSSR